MICPQCLGRHSDFLFGAGTSPPLPSAVRHTLVPEDKYYASFTNNYIHNVYVQYTVHIIFNDKWIVTSGQANGCGPSTKRSNIRMADIYE